MLWRGGRGDDCVVVGTESIVSLMARSLDESRSTWLTQHESCLKSLLWAMLDEAACRRLKEHERRDEGQLVLWTSFQDHVGLVVYVLQTPTLSLVVETIHACTQ